MVFIRTVEHKVVTGKLAKSRSIKCEPNIDTSHSSKPNFVKSPHMSYFLSNGDFVDGKVRRQS